MLPIRQSFHFKTKCPKGATQVGFCWHFFPGRMLPKAEHWSIKIRHRGLKSAFSICVSCRTGVVTGAFRETSICSAAQEQQSATAVTNALSTGFSLTRKANTHHANIRTDRPHASASVNVCSDAGLSRQSWRSSWQQRMKPVRVNFWEVHGVVLIHTIWTTICEMFTRNEFSILPKFPYKYKPPTDATFKIWSKRSVCSVTVDIFGVLSFQTVTQSWWLLLLFFNHPPRFYLTLYGSQIARISSLKSRSAILANPRQTAFLQNLSKGMNKN